MPLEYPITKEYRSAFERAFAAYLDWDFGAPEPLLDIRGSDYSIQEICELVIDFRDNAPDWVFDEVLKLITAARDRSDAIGQDCAAPLDRSYEQVASCLLCLCRARRKYYVRAVTRSASR
jgi:hypothetical protein